jgi:hypothetical protein
MLLEELRQVGRSGHSGGPPSTRGPSRLIRFISAKYIGGSGWPVSTPRTKSSSLCGASVPSWLAEKFEGLDDDPETRKLIAAAVAAGQVQKLNKHGVDNFHFYTMNRADLGFAISHLLGFRANAAREAA